MFVLKVRERLMGVDLARTTHTHKELKRLMNRHLLRLCLGLLFCVLSILLTACSGNQSTNTATATKSEPPAYEGYHDIANCNAILAWAWDMNRPNDPVKLDIYDGNVLIATVAADGFRQD